MDDEKHYPPGAEPEPAAEEAAPEKDAPEEAEPTPDKGDEETPDAGEKDKPEDKPEDETEKPDEPIIKKPRSIYDDLKDKKHEVKSEKARADAAEAKAAELQGLLDAKKDADTPAEKKEAAKDIKEFADKHGYDPEQIEELTGILAAKLPKPDAVLTPEEADAWRADRAKSARTAEDNAIDAEAPKVKTLAKELGFEIHDDAEAVAIMAEVKRLAHTKDFHDKPVDYIVFAKRAELSKLVSPKRPSFEQGGQRGDAEPEGETDFSATKGITPEMAGKANTSKRAPNLEVRRGSQVIG
jgi:hypothetical protein